MDTINDRIYSLRIQAGISQQRLADDLNLSRRAISLWGNRQKNTGHSIGSAAGWLLSGIAGLSGQG